MTRDETIALWQKCEDARAAAIKKGMSDDEAHKAAKTIWNGWADPVAEQGRAICVNRRFSITNRVDESRSAWRRRQHPEVQTWLKSARADFSKVIFDNTSNEIIQAGNKKEPLLLTCSADMFFNDFIFPGEADFTETEFRLSGIFEGTHFYFPAWFRAASFKRGAIFENTIFASDAWFRISTFNLATYFANTRFEGPVDFTAIKSLSQFDMMGADFAIVPSFNQAHFDEAPDFDNVKFPVPGFWGGSRLGLSSRYRALRRIAIQGHDYENEAKAFKGEIRSKRGTEHKPWHAVFWFGILYDALSDFGRSMMRPFCLWLVSIGLFCSLYLAHAGKLALAFMPCPDGTAHWLKSLIFALKNAILFVNWDREQINSAYACLYDIPPTELALNIPTTNALIQTAQSVWSAVLIFLFLLAVRNQFKIK